MLYFFLLKKQFSAGAPPPLQQQFFPGGSNYGSSNGNSNGNSSDRRLPMATLQSHFYPQHHLSSSSSCDGVSVVGDKYKCENPAAAKDADLFFPGGQFVDVMTAEVIKLEAMLNLSSSDFSPRWTTEHFCTCRELLKLLAGANILRILPCCPLTRSPSLPFATLLNDISPNASRQYFRCHAPYFFLRKQITTTSSERLAEPVMHPIAA